MRADGLADFKLICQKGTVAAGINDILTPDSTLMITVTALVSVKNFRPLAVAEIEFFDRHFVKHLSPAAFSMFQQNIIENIAFNMQAGAGIAEIRKQNLVNFVIPDRDAAGLGQKTFLLNFFRHAGHIGEFPDMRNQAFADLIAGKYGAFKQYDINTGLRQMRGRTAAGRPAADNQHVA